MVHSYAKSPSCLSKKKKKEDEEECMADSCRPLTPTFSPSNVIRVHEIQPGESGSAPELAERSLNNVLTVSSTHCASPTTSRVVSSPQNVFTVTPGHRATATNSRAVCSPQNVFSVSPSHRASPASLRAVSSPQNVFTVRETPLTLSGRNSVQSYNRCLFAVSPSPGKKKKYYKFYSTKYASHGKIIRQLKNQVHFLKKKLKQQSQNNLPESLLKEYNQNRDILNKIFNPDQILYLRRKSKRIKKWSNATIKKAFKHRFSCGTKGYKDLIDAGLPFPSTRTLSRRIEHVKFESGILTEVIEKLAIKVAAMREIERDCVLCLDEMSLSGSEEFDNSSGKMVGAATLPGHQGEATHALIFMVGGINSRWKQTVAYYFTPDSTNGTVLKDITVDLIQRLENIKLNVWAVASDMGGINQAMWGEFGVQSTRDALVNYIQHPVDESRHLYFIADTPHLLKNIRGMLFTHRTITIPDEIANDNFLHSSEVKLEHIQTVLDYQQEKDLKLSKNCKPEYFQLGHFSKMAVTPAYRVLNSEVAAAIEFLVYEEGYPVEMLTTAWFLRQVHRWFELMTSRHPVLALSLKNKEVYEKTIAFLKDFIKLFEGLEFPDNAWKPIQTGVILSTTSILQLQKIFLCDKGYEFLLTSRFTQDCVENLFSTLRMKQAKPSALEVKRHLKIVTVSQYMKTTVSTSNYDLDDRAFLAEFFERIDKKEPAREDERQEIGELKKLISNNVVKVDLCNGERNSLYNLSGYIARGVIRYQKVCEDCIKQILRDEEDMNNKKSYDALLRLKEFKEGALTPVNDTCFAMFEKLEENFRKAEMVFKETDNLKQLLYETSQSVVSGFRFSCCHNIKDKLIWRYITCRLRIHSAFHAKNKGKIDYGSKSVTMRVLAKQFGLGKKKKRAPRKKRVAAKKAEGPKKQVGLLRQGKAKKQVCQKGRRKQLGPQNPSPGQQVEIVLMTWMQYSHQDQVSFTPVKENCNKRFLVLA